MLLPMETDLELRFLIVRGRCGRIVGVSWRKIDCKVDDLDLALLEENWLKDISLTEEVELD
jgi:hypothetical protein